MSGANAAAASGANAEAAIFAALGDPTRLALVSRLKDGSARSIAELCAGARMSRQAVTKHLRVLENVGLVGAARFGRESRFALNPEPLRDAAAYLEGVSAQWDDALARLKNFVEE